MGWEVVLGVLGLVVMVFYRATVYEISHWFWGDDDDEDEPGVES